MNRCERCAPRSHSRPSPTQQLRAIQEWNAQYPVGTPVTYYKLRNPLREPVQTQTRVAAWLMGGHTATVMVEGIAGAVALDNVRPRLFD